MGHVLQISKVRQRLILSAKMSPEYIFLNQEISFLESLQSSRYRKTARQIR